MRLRDAPFTRDVLMALPGVVDVHSATPAAGHVILVVEAGVSDALGPYVESLAPLTTVVHLQVEGASPIDAWSSSADAERARLIADKRRDMLWALHTLALPFPAAGADARGRRAEHGWSTAGEVHEAMGGRSDWTVRGRYLDALVRQGVVERRETKHPMWRLAHAGRVELLGDVAAAAWDAGVEGVPRAADD